MTAGDVTAGAARQRSWEGGASGAGGGSGAHPQLTRRRFPASARSSAGLVALVPPLVHWFGRYVRPQGFLGTRQGSSARGRRRHGGGQRGRRGGRGAWVEATGGPAGAGVPRRVVGYLGSVVGTNKRLHNRTTGSAAFPGHSRDGKRQERTQESRRVRPRVLPLRLGGGYSVLLALRPSMVLLSHNHGHEREAGECLPAG